MSCSLTLPASSYVLIAVILLVYIALQPGLHLDWKGVKAIAAAAGNTWGLFLLVFMLGYGLVEVGITLILIFTSAGSPHQTV